jgi:HK97 family phage portal protein
VNIGKPAVLQELFSKFVYNPLARSFSTINGSLWNSLLVGNDSFSEEKVNEYRAHRIATVYICINVLYQTISALPLSVYRTKNGRTERIDDHPAYYALSQQANSYLSAAQFQGTTEIHQQSWGNGYAYINRNFTGQGESYDILDPWDVSPIIEQGQAFYKYKGEMIPGREVLHFRMFSYDGLCGLSPIRMQSNTIGAAIKQDRYSTMQLGAKPPGFLSYEGTVTPEQKTQSRDSWKKETADGSTPVLSGNWHYNPIMIPADDAAYVDSRKMTKQEIYGIYRIPPTFAQEFENATFSNAEQQDLVFTKHTVTPLIRMREQEINMKVFTEKEKKTHYVKYNLNGLLRGDLAARKEFYQSMVNTGVMSRNEARGFEDLNPYAGGDDFLVQGAMVPADLLRKQYENKVLPTVPTVPSKDLNGHSKEHSYFN